MRRGSSPAAVVWQLVSVLYDGFLATIWPIPGVRVDGAGLRCRHRKDPKVPIEDTVGGMKVPPSHITLVLQC